MAHRTERTGWVLKTQDGRYLRSERSCALVEDVDLAEFFAKQTQATRLAVSIARFRKPGLELQPVRALRAVTIHQKELG